MLWVIFGVVLGIVIFVLLYIKWAEPDVAATIAIIVACIIGIVIPFKIDLGHNERTIVKTVELVTLSTDVSSVGGGNAYYITVTGEKAYTYRYEVENTTALSGTRYKTETISGNVEEIESTECQTPMLYVYVEESKNSLWLSFNVFDRYTYVFYVPEGTIVRDVTLD